MKITSAIVGNKVEFYFVTLNNLLSSYNNIIFFNFLIFFILCAGVVSLLGVLNFSMFFSFFSNNAELESTYECGFIPFNDKHLSFNINFQKIAVLFIIFDLEVMFIFPWAVSFFYLGYFGFYTMVLFFAILWVGLYFEYRANILTI